MKPSASIVLALFCGLHRCLHSCEGDANGTPSKANTTDNANTARNPPPPIMTTARAQGNAIVTAVVTLRVVARRFAAACRRRGSRERRVATGVDAGPGNAAHDAADEERDEEREQKQQRAGRQQHKPREQTPAALHLSARCPTKGRTVKLGTENASSARPATNAEPPMSCTYSGMIGVSIHWFA